MKKSIKITDTSADHEVELCLWGNASLTLLETNKLYLISNLKINEYKN